MHHGDSVRLLGGVGLLLEFFGKTIYLGRQDELLNPRYPISLGADIYILQESFGC